MKQFLTLCCLLMINLALKAQSYSVYVTIDNIKSTKGQLVVGLFSDNNNFLKTPIAGKTVKVEGTSVTLEFNDVKKGTYAISVFHDENSNEKLDTNVMGIPKERFACSNNAKGFMGPPKWDDAKFELDNNKTIGITF